MKINKTTIHITASNPDATIEDIRKIHKANGWSDIGYHWLVDKYGVIHKGRDESLTGAHVGGHNSGNIGISYIARGKDSDSNAEFGKYMTPEQKQGLILITAQVCKKYGLSIEDIWGHNEFKGVYKACPCFKVADAAEFLESVKLKMDELPEDIKTGVNPEQAESIDGNDADGDEAKKAIRSK